MGIHSWNFALTPLLRLSAFITHASEHRLNDAEIEGNNATVETASALSRRINRLRAWKENPHGERTHHHFGGAFASAS